MPISPSYISVYLRADVRAALDKLQERYPQLSRSAIIQAAIIAAGQGKAK